MRINGNCILITGGGSGIGRALAEAFAKEGNEVVIAGRRESALAEVTKGNSKIKSLVMDIENPESIRSAGMQLAKDFPKLNVVLHNAGIMRPEKLKTPPDELKDAEAMIRTNLMGPMRLTAALLPLLMKQAHSTIMTVSSGLAFVPMAMTPTYCATKAAIHSWSQSLRWQLKGTTTEVVEIIPPYVQTELMGSHQAADPRAMPLKDFIEEVMGILKKDPEVKEVCVEKVNPLRFAVEGGKYEQTFRGLNEAMGG